MRRRMSPRTKMIIAILLVIAAGVVTWNVYKRHLAKQEVKNTVSDKTNGLYGMEMGQLDFDEVAGSLTVTNLQLTADSNVYHQLESIDDAPSVLVNIDIPLLTVEGVQTPRALLNSEIVGRKVLIKNPRIELLFTGRGKDSLKAVPDKEVYRQILGNLEMIRIDTLSVVNATFVTRDRKTGDERMAFDSVTIDLFRIAVDSLHDKDTTRILFAEEVQVNCRQAHWNSKNKLYRYRVKEIKLHSGQKRLSAHEVSIDPALPEQKFLQQFKYANDRFDVSFGQVRLINVDIPALLKEQIRADSLVSGKSSIHIYRDLSFPHDKKSRVGTYPPQMVTKLPFDMHIKTALFANAFIEYKERNAKSEKSGKVQFYQAAIRIDNLTNYKKLLAEKGMRIQFNAQFLNKVPVKATIRFPASTNGQFSIEGDMGAMPATTVNELTEPMGLARIEKGTLNSLHFEFTGNDYGAGGKLTMLYDDLKLSLLKKDSADKTLDRMKLASLLANIKVKDANPGRKGEIRQVTIHYDRDVSKSFFNLVWKTIFTGVKETVGIK